MEEIWKDIPNYEGLYQVSNYGRIKSLNYNHTKKLALLKQINEKDGYCSICLFKEGKNKRYKIHCLVAKAFIPNPNNYPCVNHKDENKNNNNVENLEWCSYKYNCNYGERNNKISKHQTTYIKCIENNTIYYNINEAERKTGVNHSNICKCLKGKLKTAGGFHWELVG